jgi:hypothetical protein
LPVVDSYSHLNKKIGVFPASKMLLAVIGIVIIPFICFIEKEFCHLLFVTALSYFLPDIN